MERSDHFLYQQALADTAGQPDLNLHRYQRAEQAARLLEYLAWLGTTHPDERFSARDLRVFAIRVLLNGAHPADVVEDLDLPESGYFDGFVLTDS